MRLLAVCHDCQHRHGITQNDILSTNAVRDWEYKHRGHRIEFLDPTAYDRSIAKHAVKEYRHNADVKLSYVADADYTITLALLASSATLLTGRESGSVDNTSDLYLDWLVTGRITTGTTPTVDTSIEVLAIAAEDDTPTWPDVFDGTDSAETITSDNVKNATVVPVARINVDATSDRSYPVRQTSLAQLFGVLPVQHALFVTHDTAVNLNSTAGNHVLTGIGVYATVI